MSNISRDGNYVYGRACSRYQIHSLTVSHGKGLRVLGLSIAMLLSLLESVLKVFLDFEVPLVCLLKLLLQLTPGTCPSAGPEHRFTFVKSCKIQTMLSSKLPFLKQSNCFHGAKTNSYVNLHVMFVESKKNIVRRRSLTAFLE